MITHPIQKEELMAYLDGELPVERAAVAATHLEHCRDCRDLATDLQSVSRQLLDWQIAPPRFAMSQRLVTALEERKSEKKQLFRKTFSFRRAPAWIWPVGAAGVLVLIGVMVRLSTSPRLMHVSEPARSEALQEGLELQRSMRSAGRSDGMAALVPLQSEAPAAAPQLKQTPEPSGPLIVRTAELSMTTQQFEKTHEEVTRILGFHQGYVAQLSLNSPSDQGHLLTATLRVPAAQLNSLLSDLRKLGRVHTESESGQEVTQQYIDLAARLKNARNTEQRLNELLRQRTGKLSDVLAVEEQIDHTRGEIESMGAELKNLSTRIAFATVQLQVAEEYKEPLRVDHSSTLGRLRNAAVEGYRSVIHGAIGVLVFLLAYGPSLLIVAAILLFPGRALWRIVRRLRREAGSH
jgi:Domain of unknown function (DUF4349)/Putative zinc-finger